MIEATGSASHDSPNPRTPPVSVRVGTHMHDVDSIEALTVAVQELTVLVRSGDREHPSDLPFGLAVQQVLEQAERAGRGRADGA